MQDWQADEKLSAEYSRRSRLFRRGNQCIIAGGIVLIGVAFAELSDRVLYLVMLPLVVGTFMGAAIFSLAMWRCPRCGRPFTRAHRRQVCEHCGTQFDFHPE